MKRYKKTGKGLLGLINNLKKPIGALLAVAFILAAYSMASADDYNEAVMQEKHALPPQSISKPERIYYDVPLSEDLQDYIIELSAGYGIDEKLVIAVIEKESGYDPDATADNGNSLGLMQIWEDFHKGEMKKLGASDLYDPWDNIAVGVDVLAGKLKTYEDTEMALMAYNAGDAGAREKYFSKGIYSNSYSRAVLAIAESLKTK